MTTYTQAQKEAVACLALPLLLALAPACAPHEPRIDSWHTEVQDFGWRITRTLARF